MLKKILKSYDYSIIIVYILLSLFGLIMIYSASMVIAIQKYNVPADYFYEKQKINLLIGFIAFLFFAIFPYKAFRNKKLLITMTIVSILGLLAVSVIGHNANNAQSWIELGARRIQPSEFVKLSVIIYLSAVYANKQKYIDQLNIGVLPPVIYLVLVCFLIKMEPDNGTAIITFLIGMVIIFCSGMKFRTIGKLVMIGIGSAALLSPFVILKFDKFFTEGNMKRITGYLDPFGTYNEQGFQLVNSYLAIGSGGLKGVGLGQGIQKYGYLPEIHTDFIMSTISEELGIFGVGFVILGIAYLVLRGIMIGARCRDSFGSMLAIGIAAMIGIQTFINLGGMSGLIPITGVTLPFISYGGSSIIVLSIAMGLLANISMFTHFDEKYRSENNVKDSHSKVKPSSVQKNFHTKKSFRQTH
ncbi:FtsW/RodA/SpoVE family cell cycle protein [Lederbergia sp. NSJ-179]|uniref:FtsW/RodA/SpoVE family cell cycle protein n=1 Tax=Lederbergia sp. NSJ-179 TaxID=2931402 RepID=UPI001FD0D2FE|nr:FtsW/RodA/SpoVE family cell cycle protein [Lederbergia sp. NSJ-179]MCJ7843265.1 FtsW/RodA/SpoVE family cell cycle protein [Lederbergia sp. NSJ-179]